MTAPLARHASPCCHRCMAEIPDIFDGLPIGIALLDRNLRYVGVNRWLADMHDLPTEALIGRPLAAALPELYRQIEPILHRVLSGESVTNVEIHHPSTGAPNRCLIGSYRPIVGAAGVEGVIVSVQDISARRAAEVALRESEEFARSILDSTTDCVKVLDLEGNLLFMNAPGLRAFGVTDFERLRGRLWASLWPPEAAPPLAAALETARAGTAARFTGRGPAETGAATWWDITVSPIAGPDGRPARLLSIARDITEAKRAQDAAEATAARLGAVLESTTDCIAVLDGDWRFTYLNRRAAALIAHGRDLLGQTLWEAFPEAVGSVFERYYRDAMARQAPVDFEEYQPSLGLWLEVHAYPGHGSLTLFFRDVTERRRAEERLAHMAHHDGLTGLANRTRLRERLALALGETGPTTPTAVFCLDLDEFKAINDTLGHAAGDRVLVDTADRLRACLGDAATIARIGGDEFAVVQAGVGGPAAASALAQRLLAAVNEPYTLGGRSVVVGASLGIALVTEPAVDPDDVLRDTDIALHRAKTEGPGRFRFFEPGMDEPLHQRQTLKEDLRRAVDRGEFCLVYQPLVDLKSMRVSGFEALVRWRHPSRGLVPPVDFIPLAEETGAIVEIGAWVLRRACHIAAAWPDGIWVAVNLSPVQFRDPGLVATAAAALRDSGLAAHRLQLEITESVLLHDSAGNLAVLHDLRRLGVKIAMDDFGTGYSSLSYLRSFPFDKIKIDRSFVSDLPHSAESRAIVRAMVGLGRNLNIATTAEGIETPEQMQGLRGKGCSEGQGYLFSRPVAAEEVLGVIERLRRQRPGRRRAVRAARP